MTNGVEGRMRNNNKKALLVTTVSGFLPQFELNNVKLLQELGYEVHYASNFNHPAYKKSCNFDELGIRTHPITIRKSPFCFWENLWAFLQLRELILRYGFSLVHCHTPMGGAIARLAALTVKKKPWVIYTAHGFHFYKGAPIWNWLFYPIERILACFTNCLITINHEDLAYARSFRLGKNGFSAWIPGEGIDMETFHAEAGKFTKEQLGIPEEALFILSVGELNKNKNHIAILKAMERLKDPLIYYGICGTGKHKYRKKLLAAAKKCGLENRFRLFGYQEQVEKYLQAADVFAFPSRREGLGMAALEAMASGCPILAADNRGTREFMKDKYTGIVVPPDDISGFADAILQLKNKQYRMKLSQNCPKRARHFCKEASQKRMSRIYQECEKRLLLNASNQKRNG